MKKSDEIWRKILSEQQFCITREGKTEQAGSSPLNKEYRNGVFNCVCCDERLFSSTTKYDSGSGWPSFFAPINKQKITEKHDVSLLRRRIEITCTKCEAHLGHVFNDGPEPTGLRYCINGVALKFIPKIKMEK